jgi:predicted enzyme related to lactoylglutathione lyase
MSSIAKATAWAFTQPGDAMHTDATHRKGPETGTGLFLGLRSALYPAPDLERAKAWYSQVLGRRPYFDEAYYVGFEVGGFELGLLPDAKPSTAGAQPLWGVSDIAAALSRLLDFGATLLEPVTDVGGGIRVAAVADPLGNRLGLIENPNFDPARSR